MKKILIANWKMYMNIRSADSFLSCMNAVYGADVRIAPPCTLIASMKEHAESLGVTLGAQNMNENKEGSYTGEVSCEMLKEVGAKFVLLGHSERRHKFGETNALIEKKSGEGCC